MTLYDPLMYLHHTRGRQIDQRLGNGGQFGFFSFAARNMYTPWGVRAANSRKRNAGSGDYNSVTTICTAVSFCHARARAHAEQQLRPRPRPRPCRGPFVGVLVAVNSSSFDSPHVRRDTPPCGPSVRVVSLTNPRKNPPDNYHRCFLRQRASDDGPGVVPVEGHAPGAVVFWFEAREAGERGPP